MVNERKVTVVVGGYLGDEGKGKATQAATSRSNKMENRVALVSRVSGGTNTGATIRTTTGDEIGIHMVPAGAFEVGCPSYIGSACYLNPTALEQELELRNKYLKKEERGGVYISKFCNVVTSDCLREDREKEKEQGYGSTQNGVSTTAARKYAYKGMQAHELKSFTLNKFEREYRAVLVDPYEFFTTTAKDWDVIIEGSQGVGLDVNHGFQYPYVSAGSFSTYGLLDGVGYALAPTEVIMVLKTYGSYFGPERYRGNFNDDEFREFAGEFGTTTGRPRNLCWLDAELLERVASLVRPTKIMLNRMDTLDWFPEHDKPWSYVVNDENITNFADKPMVDGRLTNAGAFFIEMIEEACHAPVAYLGTGPSWKDVIER